MAGDQAPLQPMFGEGEPIGERIGKAVKWLEETAHSEPGSPGHDDNEELSWHVVLDDEPVDCYLEWEPTLDVPQPRFTRVYGRSDVEVFVHNPTLPEGYRTTHIPRKGHKPMPGAPGEPLPEADLLLALALEETKDAIQNQHVAVGSGE